MNLISWNFVFRIGIAFYIFNSTQSAYTIETMADKVAEMEQKNIVLSDEVTRLHTELSKSHSKS